MSRMRALAPRMVGRQAQLQELEEHLAQVRAGSGWVVLLAGDAGVGKTRLLRAFLEHAQHHPDVEVLQGYCYEEQPPAPYGPFIDALRALVRVRGPEPVAQAAGLLAGDLLPLLPELGLSPPPSGSLCDPQSRKQRLFEALYRVLRPQAAGQCRILVLEDLHWADQTSLELLRYLARAAEREPLLLLGTYRADEVDRGHPLHHARAQLMRDRLLEELHLAPLPRAELARLLAETLGRAVPDPFLIAVEDRTGGNPFFVEEILRWLLDEGRLDTALQAGSSDLAVGIPHSIAESIRRRTADLDGATREVLRHAAVIGRRFDFDLLLRLTRLEEAALVQAVERLVERQIVMEEPGSREDRYSFRHALSREAVYAELLGRDRRRKHRAVLQVLEELYPARGEAVLDQLAYHSLQAGDLARAARYAEQAGDRSARIYAFREAIGQYETALELLHSGDGGERAGLLVRLGDVAYPLGDSGRYERYWQEAQRHYAEAEEWIKAGDLACRLGQAAKDRHAMEAAFTYTNTAVAMLETQPPGHVLGMAYAYLANLHRNTTRPREAIARAEAALRVAAADGDAEVEAEALGEIAMSLWGLGEPARAVVYAERSLARAQSTGVVKSVLGAYMWLGRLLSTLGEYRRAGTVLREGMRVAEQHGWGMRLTGDCETLGWVEMELGRWEQAHEASEQSIRAAELGHPFGRRGVVPKAELLLRQGRAEGARKLLEEEYPPEIRVPNGDYRSWTILAQAYVALHEPQRALAAMERSAGEWYASDWIVRRADFQWGLGHAIEVWLQVGRADQAGELWSLLAPIAERASSAGAQAYCAQAKGLIAASESRHQEAAISFGQAVDLWQQQEAPYLEAHARRLRAESLLQTGDPGDRDEAGSELVTAQVICTTLGAPLELKALATLANRHGLVPKPAQPLTGQTPGLTRREREVLVHIARGFSNRAIAERLMITQKTVETHVGNILGKLSCTSRAQAAAYAVEHGLATSATPKRRPSYP